MKPKNMLNRRQFIKKTAMSAAAFSVLPANVIGGPGRVAPNDKLNVALVGCGMQGLGSLKGWLKIPEIQFTAVCDPNKESYDYPVWGSPRGEIRGLHGGREVGRQRVNAYYEQKMGKGKYRGCAAYADFREMLEKEKDLDIVFIMTPDHLHSTIAVAAMKKGVRVATHKPIGNFMQETRVAVETARKTELPTHCFFFQDPPNTYVLSELINNGVVGKIKELHRWTNRPFWPQGMTELPEPQPVPRGFDWQLWLGPSKYRPYSPAYTHAVFRGWYEFGAGCLADMGFYGLWKDWRILNLGMPVSAMANKSFTCEVKEYRCHSIENNLSFPYASSIHLDVTVTKGGDNIDVYWYDGGMKPQTPKIMRNKDQELDATGVLFVGEDGIIKATYGYDKIEILGNKQSEDIVSSVKVPESYLEKSDNEMVKAFQGIKPSRGDFQHAQTISEAVCLGNLAIRVSDQRLKWDQDNFRVSNVEEANQYLKRDSREGWELRL